MAASWSCLSVLSTAQVPISRCCSLTLQGGDLSLDIGDGLAQTHFKEVGPVCARKHTQKASCQTSGVASEPARSPRRRTQ